MSKKKPTISKIKPFLWRPGEGCDPDALARLQQTFRRPAEPMGAAWLMGERRFFPDLMGDLAGISIARLSEVLFEVTTGPQNFGPQKEWTTWFNYILARTLPRAHEYSAFSFHLETLISAFMGQYRTGKEAEAYPGFFEDVLATLGRSVMDAECWYEGSFVGGLIQREVTRRKGTWRWFAVSGDLSASMFLCLKFLPNEAVAGWLRSVLAIPCPLWRAHVLAWFVGAYDILNARSAGPSDLRIGVQPSVCWNHAEQLRYSLSTDDETVFLPPQNRIIALETVTAFVTDEVYLDWLCSIGEVEELEADLGDIPDAFRSLYKAAC